MQLHSPSVRLDDHSVLFEWGDINNACSFKVNKAEYIQLACKACSTPLVLVESHQQTHTCQCGREISADLCELNHRVTDYGRWTSYFGRGRCKDHYDLLLKDGSIVKHCYPNGGKFGMPFMDAQPHVKVRRDILDEEVLMIRLVPDAELKRFPGVLRGRVRESRNIEYNGDAFPRKDRIAAINGLYTILV